MHYLSSHALYSTKEEDGPITLSLQMGKEQKARTQIYLGDTLYKEMKGSFENLILGTNVGLRRKLFSIHTTMAEFGSHTKQTSVKVTLRGGQRVLSLPVQKFAVPEPRSVVMYGLRVVVV